MGNINYAVSDANEVARHFLACRALTHKQIHKLLFFAYLEYLQQNNKDINSLQNKLFENKFEAWVHGPVYAPIYPIYADSGSSLIELIGEEISIKNEKVIKFLDYILEKYKDLDGDDLEELSHKMIAWKKARNGLSYWDISNNPILDEDIFNSRI